MKILIISGAYSKKSRLKSLLAFLGELLKQHGHSIEDWDVYEKKLPLLDPTEEKNQIALQLDEAIDAADGIVIGSPLYHNSLSGALKNTLDHLEYTIFKNKKVGLVSVAGSARTSALLFPHFRSVISEMRGDVVYTTLGAAMDDFKKDSEGEYVLVNEEIRQRGEQLMNDLTKNNDF